MASYWRSPYKETANSYHNGDSTTDSLTPRMDINLTRLTNGEQPQTSSSPSFEWLDRPSPIISHDLQLHNRRTNARTIKGILKTPSDLDGPRTTRSSQTVESLMSSPRTNSTTPRREKKKVTFGHYEYSSDNERAPGRFRIRHDRAMSAHYHGLKHVQPLDEYARQNLKKLLGYVAGAGPLPSVKGKALVSSEDNGNVMSTVNGVICRHSPDLRCARCFRDNDGKISDSDVAANSGAPASKADKEGESTQTSDYSHVTNQQNDPSETVHSKDVGLPNASSDDADSTVKEELARKSPPHWTKSFIRSPIHRHSARYLVGRHVRSAYGQRKKWPESIPVRQLEPLPIPTVTEDLTKLYITGDGQIIGTKRKKSSSVDNDREGVASPGSASSNGRVGYKIPATPTTHVNGVGVSHDAGQPPKSAPTKSMKTGNRYDSNNRSFVRHRDADMDVYLDKTSQILTWLKEVRQKQNYVPRKSRLYALEPQQLH